MLAGLLAAYRSDTYAGDRAKGIHRLIDRDRWQSHVEAATPPATLAVCTFDGPPELRNAVVKLRDEDYARGWLDPCGWRAEDRTLIARNDFYAATLKRDLGEWLTKWNVRVEVAAVAKGAAA